MGKRGFTQTDLYAVIGTAALIAVLALVLLHSSTAYQRELARNYGVQVLEALESWQTRHPGDSLAAVLGAGYFEPASYHGKPDHMRESSRAVDCSRGGALGGVAWPAAPERIGCAMFVETREGVEVPLVYTWLEGDVTFFVNGVGE